MAEEGADPKERQWNMNEWCWDPYNMLALASDAKNIEAARKPAAPFSFGTGPYASQSQLAPAASLLVDEASRGASRGKGPATCQVAACSADLTTLKEYHQRYKICEFHLKVSSIIREGKRQRFCQQCGRFHDVTSFDGDKRSCRARLQRHNARRRKKTADSDTPSASKAPPVKRQSSLSRNTREFMRSDSSKKQQTSDSASMETKEECLGGRGGSLETDSQQQQQQLRQSLRNSNSASDSQIGRQLQASHAALGEESGSQLAARLNSSAFGTDQMQLPFHGQSAGMPARMPARMPSSSDIPKSFPPVAYGNDTSMDNLDYLGNVGLFPPQQSESMPDYSDLNQAASQMQSTGFGTTDQSGASTATAASLVDEARALLTYSGQYQAIEYTSEEHFTRMSAKLFRCTPEQLPGDLKANLLAMLQCGVNALEGYIRPGCLHLTLNAMVGTSIEKKLNGLDVRGLFNHLAASSNKALWTAETLVLQWYDEAALVRDGKIMHVLSTAGSQGILPQLQHVQPVALHTDLPERVLLTGSNLAIVDNRVLARCLGNDVAVEVMSSGFHDAEGEDDRLSYVEVKVPQKQRAGILHLEVARGSLLSRSKPVLMLDQADVAADLNRLQSLEHAGVDMDSLLLDLGKIVELKHAIAAAKFGSSMPVRTFTATDMAAMAQLARRQLRLAIDTVCVPLATFVLPVAIADAQSMAEAVEKIEAVLDMPLLLRAVCSKSVPLIQMVLEWTSAVGVDLLAGVPGPHGLTPLHLAAVMEDGASLAALLTESCLDGASAWTAARSCGASPADLACASGNQATHEHVLQLLHKRLAAAFADDEDIEDSASVDDELMVDPETGELLECDGLLESNAQDGPLTKVAAPTEEALQRLSEARKQDCADSARGTLQHQSSSMTTGSSLNTSSMSSTDTVLPKVSELRCAYPPSRLRKREASDATASKVLEYTPEAKGKGSPRFSESSKSADLDFFQNASSMKVAPNVFDGTYALASTLLIGACGGLTLLLRYWGTAFLD